MKLNNKHKRAVKRQLDVEQGVRPPGSSVFVNKKKYNRKLKHKKLPASSKSMAFPTAMVSLAAGAAAS